MINKYLSQKAQIITNALIAFLDEQQQDTASLKYDCLPFLKKFVISGKMYRGGLVYLGYDLFAQKKSSELSNDSQDYKFLLKLAMVVELTHSAFLLHDDVMDQDDFRRGQQTFHSLMTDKMVDEGIINASHLGESLAVCLGDLLIFWSGKLLLDGTLDLQNTLLAKKINQFYHHEMDLTAWGQMDDVYLASKKGLIDRELIFHVYSLKSGHYSVVNPLLLGAILAQPSKDQLELLTKLATNLGIIFQIKDDQMNLFGTSEVIGKSVGSDIREDKKTIFRNILFEEADAKDQKQLLNLFGNKQLDQQDLDLVKSLIKKYGVLEKSQILIDKLEREVQTVANELQLSISSKDLLQNFIQLMIKRKK